MIDGDKNMSNKENKQNQIEIRNDALKTALTDLKNERNATNEQKMLTSLKDAKLLAPVLFNVPINNNQSGKIKLPKDTKLKFVLVNTKEKKSYFPIFTDLEEAKKLPVQQGQTVQFIVRSLKDYENVLNDNKNNASGIALNPMSDNIILPTTLVNRINKGETIHPSVVNATSSQEVRYVEPNIYPTAVVNAVYDLCCTKEEVNRVWLKAMIDGISTSFALIVDAEGKKEELFAEIQKAATEKSKGTNIVVLDATKDLLDKVIKDAVPLYDKELDFNAD